MVVIMVVVVVVLVVMVVASDDCCRSEQGAHVCLRLAPGHGHGKRAFHGAPSGGEGNLLLAVPRFDTR